MPSNNPVADWSTQSETCICGACRSARQRRERDTQRAPALVFSDAAAEHIERLVAGWTQTQIARRAGLSVAKERGVVLNSRTEAAILTVR